MIEGIGFAAADGETQCPNEYNPGIEDQQNLNETTEGKYLNLEEDIYLKRNGNCTKFEHRNPTYRGANLPVNEGANDQNYNDND